MEFFEEYRKKRKIKKFEQYVDDVFYFLDDKFGEGYYIKKNDTLAYCREQQEVIDLEDAFNRGIYGSYISRNLQQFSKKIKEENTEQEQLTLYPITDNDDIEPTKEVIDDLTSNCEED